MMAQQPSNSCLANITQTEMGAVNKICGNKTPALIPLGFLPTKGSEITSTFVSKNWGAICDLWPSLQDDGMGNLDYREKHALTLLQTFHQDTTSSIHKYYREHIRSLAIRHEVIDKRTGTILKNEVAIIEAVLTTQGDATLEYVNLAVEVVKKPIQEKRVWLDRVESAMAVKYNFKTTREGRKTKSFIDSIAQDMLNNKTNQVFRRIMWKNTNAVWYERMNKNLKPYLQEKTGFKETNIPMCGGYLVHHVKLDHDASSFHDVKVAINQAQANGVPKEQILVFLEKLYSGKQVDTKV